MVFVTGDTHSEFRRFATKKFPEQKQMGREDYVIICGDFGGIWDDSREENAKLDWLNEKPFTTLFVDGNHENYTMLNRFPVEEWRGGKVHHIRPNILHLMRGQLYDIEGHTFFTMGGASCHDIQDGILDPDEPNFKQKFRRKYAAGEMFRVLGVSWWPEELPSEDEYTQALSTLEQANWKVDFVISHCAPSSVARQLYANVQTDRLTDFFDDISKRLEFQHWMFGHYHEHGKVGRNYTVLYDKVERIL